MEVSTEKCILFLFSFAKKEQKVRENPQIYKNNPNILKLFLALKRIQKVVSKKLKEKRLGGLKYLEAYSKVPARVKGCLELPLKP